MIKRVCTQCGMDYAPDDTATKCDRVTSGTFCGGEIQPGPITPAPEAKCLVCMDSGVVEIHDPREARPETRACPNGCHRKELL